MPARTAKGELGQVLFLVTLGWCVSADVSRHVPAKKQAIPAKLQYAYLSNDGTQGSRCPGLLGCNRVQCTPDT